MRLFLISFLFFANHAFAEPNYLSLNCLENYKELANNKYEGPGDQWATSVGDDMARRGGKSKKQRKYKKKRNRVFILFPCFSSLSLSLTASVSYLFLFTFIYT